MKPNFQQITHIYNHAFAAIIGQAIVSFAIILILYSHVNTNELILWSLLKFTLLIIRALSIHFYRPYFNSKDHSINIYQWFYFYRAIMFLSAVLWAFSLYFVGQYEPTNLLFFFLATFVAMSGAAIATLGSVNSIYLAFTLPLLTASVIALISSPEPAHFETGLLTLVGFTFLIYAAFKNSNTISELLQRTIEVEAAHNDIVNRLAMAGEYRDNDTGQHVKRMSYSCYLLAIKAGLTEREAKQLQSASALHDIGKIGIADSILLHPEKLNQQDWAIMKTHTTIGAHILSNHNSPMMELAAMVASGHHERWNGSGYPKGIAGEDIPLETRIVSICDTFDALISKRPYKKAWSIVDALSYINNESGTHFDPQLVDLFLSISNDIIQYAEDNNDYTDDQLPV